MKTRQSTHSRIRWMTEEDVSRVLEIETVCFLDPIKEKDLWKILSEKKTIGIVIETCSEEVAKKDRVVGLCIFKLRAYSIEIFTLAVHPDFREQGFGGQLIEKIKNKLGNSYSSIYSYVPEEELKFLYFLKARGFKPTQIIGNFWGDDVDAIRMEYVEQQK